jgi:hypothetical protein
MNSTQQENIIAQLTAERDHYKAFADKFDNDFADILERVAPPTPIVIIDEALLARIAELESQVKRLTDVPVGSVWTWVGTGDRVTVKAVNGDRITTRPEERAVSDYFWDRDAFIAHHRLETA